MAGMIDGCKEKGEQFPFYTPSAVFKAVEFQIEANELGLQNHQWVPL
jgi:hypothetical protein